MTQFPIVTLTPEQVRVDPANVFRHDNAEIQRLVGVIQEHGVLSAICVDAATAQGKNGETSYQLVGGEARLEAYKSLGITEFPAILATFETEQQRTSAAIALNASFGHFDDAALTATLKELAEAGADLDFTGLEPFRLDELLGEAPVFAGDPDEVPDLPAGEPITQRGDVILLGRHRLICGDCRDEDTAARLLMGQKMNVVMTSPPYASQREYDAESGFEPIRPEQYGDWYRDVAACIEKCLAPDGSYFLNIKEHCEDGQRHLYVKDLTLAHVRDWNWRFIDEFCWHRKGVPGGWPNRFKNEWEPVFHFALSDHIKFRPDAVGHESANAFSYDPSMPKTPAGFLSGKKNADGRGKADIVREGIARPGNHITVQTGEAHVTGMHSATYPVALPEFFIAAFSDEGDSVFDPFMGSGTTLIAAEQTGRVAHGCEVSGKYCDVIVERFERLTGVPAQRPERVAA